MSHKTTLSANGSTAYVRTLGTEYTISATGTWGSGTLTPKVKDADGTAVTWGTTTLKADGSIGVVVPRGADLGATLSGATNPSLVVHIAKVR